MNSPIAETRDQSLHFLMCFAISFATILSRPFWWVAILAIVLAYGFAMTREYYQHGRIVWINFDLYFCAAGSLAGLVGALI